MSTTNELVADIETRLDDLEDAYLGGLEADRVRKGESSTRPLDAVIEELGLDG
jgi:predicted DNA-binding protein